MTNKRIIFLFCKEFVIRNELVLKKMCKFDSREKKDFIL